MRSTLLGLIAHAALVLSTEVVYVTDLTIYTLLAPCAQYGVSSAIMAQTFESCGDDPTSLQSCVCTKNGMMNQVLQTMSSSLSWSCGTTASDDHASASVVVSQYCDPDGTYSFSTPTTNLVEEYPTDFPEFYNLAPCAQYGVSVAMQTMTYDICPEPPSLLAPCICGKNQNSLRASQTISSSVKYSCSNNEDITSAQAFLAAYCAMTAGTTSFPAPSSPQATVLTYYISALPEYKSLIPCAQSGVDDALAIHSADFCPPGPQAFGSCVCLKTGMSSRATSRMSSSVRWNCDSTARDDVLSAVSVFEYYCSAVRGEVTPTGVTESIAQATNSTPRQTGGSGSDGNSTDSDKKMMIPIAKVGKKASEAAAEAASAAYRPPPSTDKPELAGTPIHAMPPSSPRPSIAISHTSGHTPTPQYDPTNPPPMPELQGMVKPYVGTPPPMQPELAGHQMMPQELHGQGYGQAIPMQTYNQAYGAPSPQSASPYPAYPGHPSPHSPQAGYYAPTACTAQRTG
ncbi:unnamed protein product [Parascedosporium putredinis]|uniref:Extracellular membrane protein CFEM domain-containing protein n=1 Tax=Parascedosporium putredinis TaxID=1442378 RepID=A0A9P1H906_9PEZI|nr:unnamed protein product [Parascedosporium putredinis]CAI8000343.1 unnamed protein product [Parascedosporium putredinis]